MSCTGLCLGFPKLFLLQSHLSLCHCQPIANGLPTKESNTHTHTLVRQFYWHSCGQMENGGLSHSTALQTSAFTLLHTFPKCSLPWQLFHPFQLTQPLSLYLFFFSFPPPPSLLQPHGFSPYTLGHFLQVKSQMPALARQAT